MSYLKLMSTGIVFAAMLQVPPVFAQSESDPDIDRPMPPWSSVWASARIVDHDEFYLYDEESVTVIDYKKERIIRVCNDIKQHSVPLDITYDGKKATVRAGDCIRVEAKSVSISAGDDLESGWDISGTIETINSE